MGSKRFALVVGAFCACLGMNAHHVTAQFGENITHFNIQLRYETPVTPDVQSIFDSAKARWESVIISDWGTSVSLSQGQEICGQPAPASEIIDDMLIYVFVGSIDGEGNVLARAGPCAVDDAGNIRVGVMQFDLADLQRLILTNRAQATVLHEMGHVLGFGTLWEQRALIGEVDGDHELDDYELRYLGEQGNIGNEEVGMRYEAVIEDSGGEGTARSHWEEDIYQDELMTGYIPDSGVAPMSELTIRALADLGYDVDPTKADVYEVNPDIVENLDWDDLRESSKASLRGSLRQNVKAKRTHKKESYGQDTIQIAITTLVSEPKRR